MIHWRRLSIFGSVLGIIALCFLAFTKENLLWDSIAILIFVIGWILIIFDEREL